MIPAEARREAIRVVVARTLPVAAATLPVQAALHWFLRPPWNERAAMALAGVVTVSLCVYFLRVFHPRFGFARARTLRMLPARYGRAVALTFDDGPFPETTPQLLEWLAAEDARATFFLVGERARLHPEIVKRIAESGHAIGLHGMRHRSMALLSAREISRDLAEGRFIIESALEKPLPALLFRPPYGFRSGTLVRTVSSLGWTLAGWSFDTRDYAAHKKTVTEAGRVRPGDIVLLHEQPDLDSSTEPALAALLKELRVESLSLVTLYGAASPGVLPGDSEPLG